MSLPRVPKWGGPQKDTVSQNPREDIISKTREQRVYNTAEKASEVKPDHLHGFSANSVGNGTEQTERAAQRACEMPSVTAEPTAEVGRGARTRKGCIRVRRADQGEPLGILALTPCHQNDQSSMLSCTGQVCPWQEEATVHAFLANVTEGR